jgi:uncharacterized membrane protein YgdD (TMEM256/DUF423 family)
VEARILRLGAVLALVGVALGAFGAHGLAGRVSAARLDTFKTGVHYHLLHSLALLAVAWAASRWPGRRAEVAAWLFTIGIVIFSGSLYALVLWDLPRLGMITPVGGVAFLAGWACLVLTPVSR